MACSDRVVVQLKSFIGDAVMAAPLLESLKGQVELFVAAPPLIGQVLGPEWSDCFVPIRGRGLRPQLAALRSVKADVSIVLNRSFRSALAARAADIKRRVGHNVEGRGFLLTDRVPFDANRHEVESYLDLARSCGYATPVVEPHLSVTDAERKRGSELLDGADVALQPGARHAYKRLPMPALVATARAIVESGGRVVLIGGSEEAECAESLIESAGLDCLNLVGKTSMRETVGLLANCRLAVGSDTGVMHLAAAVGRPTVTVFEPSQPASRWGHLYKPHRTIEAPQEGIDRLDPTALASVVREVLSERSSAGSRAP